MTRTYLTRKTTDTGFRFQIDGRGAWLSEYKTDCRLGNGEYRVFDVECGRVVAVWVQDTIGHEFRPAR